MIYNQSERFALEHLPFEEGNTFFENFMLEGGDNDLLGLERFPHIVEAAGLCVCLEGESEITIESQSYRLKKGDLCVIFPNDIVYVRKKSSDFKGYTVACTPEFLMSVNISSGTPIYLYIKDHPCISLKDDEQEELIKMCDFLKEHDARKDHPCTEEISKHLFSAIIYEVIGIYKKGKPLDQQPYSRKNRLFFEFQELVARNYRKQRGIEFYADKLCISSRHLSAICKEITGCTAKECINEHIVVNIQVLLSTTDMTIAQISEGLDFPNASFFTKFFKEQTGMTPKAYRNVNRT